MSEPFLGEIKIFPMGYAPRGWLPCEGQSLQISQNQALYALLGAAYGGNGVTNFNLPDLRGRVPIHVSTEFTRGQAGGEDYHALTASGMPQHTHYPVGSTSDATSKTPTNNVWAVPAVNAYHPSANAVMNTGALTTAGRGEGHPNMQPYLALQFCIAVSGIFPTRD